MRMLQVQIPLWSLAGFVFDSVSFLCLLQLLLRYWSIFVNSALEGINLLLKFIIFLQMDSKNSELLNC